MQSYRILLLFAAVALLGAGGLITRAVLHRPASQPAATPQAEAVIAMRQVLVAKADLAGGQFLEESDLTWRDRPANTLRPDLYLHGADSTAPLQGAVLLRPLKAGEAIQRGDVVSPRERGFLAAVLPPDKRSVTVAVDEVAGNAGLIFPGDRVDMIVTHSEPRAEDPSRQVLGQTVLEDVRILAVDQALRGPTEEAGKDGKVSAAVAQRRGAARTVTLEVSPRDAGVVAVAVNLGRVTLALRSMAADRIADADGKDVGKVVWAGDVMASLSELRVTAPTTDSQPAPAEGVVLLRGGGGVR